MEARLNKATIMTAKAQAAYAKARRRMRNRVQRGARLLDEKYPNWISKVEVDTLDMADPNMCIVGQTFMNGLTQPYHGGLIKLGITVDRKFSFSDRTEADDENAYRYGFDIGDYYDEYPEIGVAQGCWSLLAELWVSEINKRKVK